MVRLPQRSQGGGPKGAGGHERRQTHRGRCGLNCATRLCLLDLRRTFACKAAYAIRKQTVEPVFGIIKSVMGFRQFSLRGVRKVTGEWNLVCLAWNVKRMAVLRPKVG